MGDVRWENGKRKKRKEINSAREVEYEKKQEKGERKMKEAKGGERRRGAWREEEVTNVVN